MEGARAHRTTECIAWGAFVRRREPRGNRVGLAGLGCARTGACAPYGSLLDLDLRTLLFEAALIFSASSFATPSLTGFGAASTRSRPP